MEPGEEEGVMRKQLREWAEEAGASQVWWGHRPQQELYFILKCIEKAFVGSQLLLGVWFNLGCISKTYREVAKMVICVIYVYFAIILEILI